MKKTILVLALLTSVPLYFTSCDTLQGIAKEVLLEPTVDEIGRGLKEALDKGITKGVERLSAKDGYYRSPYKIQLPSAAQQVTARLKVIPGFEQLEENLLEKINRGAETAAKEATPIFVSAIRALTFKDVTNLLMGADNAATDYLQRTTQEQLYGKFNPVIVRSLDQVGANALWKKAADAYNKIPFITKVNNDLDDYITKEALKGLFAQIESEEKNIRHNKLARTSDLLRKVFAKQDSNRK
jgi:predicted small secreted protein